MSCPNCKRLCDKLVISNSVTVVGGNLVINVPAGNYINGEKYCLVVAQSIPTTTPIGAQVFMTIGGATTTYYPVLNADCTNVTVCSINTRTRYSGVIRTDIQSGVFKLIGKVPCSHCTSTRSTLLAAPIAEAQEVLRGGDEK